MKNSTDLTAQKCVACEGGVEPLTKGDIDAFLTHTPEWEVASDNKSISRTFTFKDFKESLVFTNQIGAIAEEEGHHPDISLHGYKYVTVTLTTHAIDGLFQNDFIVAAKIDKILATERK